MIEIISHFLTRLRSKSNLKSLALLMKFKRPSEFDTIGFGLKKLTSNGFVALFRKITNVVPEN